LNFSTLVLALGSVVVATAGQILMRLSQTSPALAVVGGIRLSGALILALTCHGVAAVLWLLVVAKVPVSRAYPITALTHALVPLAACIILREALSWRTLLALTLAGGAVLVVR